jgi:N-methylhydantoinase B
LNCGYLKNPKRQYVLTKGGTVLLGTPGGGGHGPAAERAEVARQADETAGYVPTISTRL